MNEEGRTFAVVAVCRGRTLAAVALWPQSLRFWRVKGERPQQKWKDRGKSGETAAKAERSRPRRRDCRKSGETAARESNFLKNKSLDETFPKSLVKIRDFLKQRQKVRSCKNSKLLFFEFIFEKKFNLIQYEMAKAERPQQKRKDHGKSGETTAKAERPRQKRRDRG